MSYSFRSHSTEYGNSEILPVSAWDWPQPEPFVLLSHTHIPLLLLSVSSSIAADTPCRAKANDVQLMRDCDWPWRFSVTETIHLWKIDYPEFKTAKI